MNKRLKSIAADISITVLILVSAFSVSILLQDVLEIDEHISTLFAFAVLEIAVLR